MELALPGRRVPGPSVLTGIPQETRGQVGAGEGDPPEQGGGQ